MKDGAPFAFTLLTAPIDTWTRSAQIVQGMLAELGIQMDIQTFEFGTLLETLKAGEQQADFMGYTYTSPRHPLLVVSLVEHWLPAWRTATLTTRGLMNLSSSRGSKP